MIRGEGQRLAVGAAFLIFFAGAAQARIIAPDLHFGGIDQWGVALNVMMHFWINKGLVGAGLIAKFGVAYWSFTALALLSQVAMITLVFYLNRQHFKPRLAAQSVPAE